MSYAVQVSGKSKKVEDLLVKFNEIENSIKEDPYWIVILEQNIN